jgi:hypothetical protein
LRVEVAPIANMIVKLFGLDRLAVEPTLVAMSGFVSVAEHHVFFQYTLR